ncbi:hypothetical protein D9M70_395370 [compost metagenome]
MLHVEPQLPKLLRLSKGEPWLVRCIDRINVAPADLAALRRGEAPRPQPAWRKYLSKVLKNSRAWCLQLDDTRTQAREILQILVTSPELTSYLAVTHPYFCLKLFEADVVTRSDFIEECLDAMLDAPASRLYVELKSNQNQNGGHRLALPESNRLLRFFFADSTAAVDNGLYRAIGEAVFRRLDEDGKLAAKFNEPLKSYAELGRLRCPINSGITMFEIMVHEGIHQGLQDHMWLHYFQHFAREILKQMSSLPAEQEHLEWPTPFHYLLSRLIRVTTGWAEQCVHIEDSEISKGTREEKGFDRCYISKEATKALGEMLQIIIPSPKISDSFKRYLLASVIRSHNWLQAKGDFADVANSLRSAVTRGIDWPAECAYRAELLEHFQGLDHRLRMDAELFEKALLESTAECQRR